MQDILIVIIIAIVLFSVLRRILFRSVYSSFMKQYQDLQRQHEKKSNVVKQEGEITIEKIKPGTGSRDNEEYTDYEEIK